MTGPYLRNPIAIKETLSNLGFPGGFNQYINTNIVTPNIKKKPAGPRRPLKSLSDNNHRAEYQVFQPIHIRNKPILKHLNQIVFLHLSMLEPNLKRRNVRNKQKYSQIR